MNAQGTERKLAAIMFTDMVGYSALAQRNEALALDLLAEHQRLLRPIFRAHGGHEIKAIGDGFLVELSSALQAMRCAIAIQTALAERNASTAPERRIQLRIGLHLGDVEMRDGDVFGDGVNIAARVVPLADAGGICITGPVFDQVRNKIDEPLARLATPELKNIEIPIDVYRVVLPWTQPSRAGLVPGTGSKTRWRPGIVAPVAVLLVVVGIMLWRHQRLVAIAPQMTSSPAPSPPPAPSEDRKSVAVLPFINMSGDDADEYLSDGMSEEIIAALSKVTGLRVAARTSSFFFKGKNEDIEKIGEKLRVGTVVEGSVRRAGTKLRVAVQLINVSDGYHLWSDTYDRDTTDILAIETDVAQRVAGALKVTLHGSERERLQNKPTENPQAHQLYLKGRYYVNRYTEDGLKKGLASLQQSIALDPSYALAYQGLAYYYSVVNDWFLAPKDAMPRMRSAAEKALQIDPTLSEPHTFSADVAWMYDWNWPAADEAFKRALALDADSVVAHEFYGQYLSAIGLAREGVAECKRAVALDPLSPEANTFLGLTSYFARRYGEAIAQFRETLEIEPSYSLAHLSLGGAYVQNGELESGIAELLRAKELDPHNPGTISALGHAYAAAGDRDAAQRMIDELRHQSQVSYVSPYFFAVIHTALGDIDQAFTFLDAAYDAHSFFIAWLKVEPAMDPLRDDPRFAGLLKKVGLEP